MKRIKLFESFEEGSKSFEKGDFVTLEDGRRGKIVGVSYGYGATMYEVDLGGNDIVHLPEYGLSKI